MSPKSGGCHNSGTSVPREDMEPVDRYVYVLTDPPGVSTELALNSQRRGIIPGVDVVAPYFAIWLGPDPINEALKAV